MVVHIFIIPVLGRLKQKDLKSKASLCYKVRCWLKKKKKINK